MNEEKDIIPCVSGWNCFTQETEITLHDVISQYKDSPNLQGYIKSFIDTAVDAIRDLEKLSLIFAPGCVSGEALDLVGRIVGQPRPFIDPETAPWFGFEGDGVDDPMVLGFGEGIFWDGKAPLLGDKPADDETYKIFILARIAKNTGRGTVDDMLAIIQQITCRDDIYIRGANGIVEPYYTLFDETGDPPTGDPMGAGLGVGGFTNDNGDTLVGPMQFAIIGTKGPIDTTTRVLLLTYDILPRPAGVKLVEVR